MITTKNAREYLQNAYSTKLVSKGVEYFKTLLLEKASSIFGYKNLPVTILPTDIEKMLIIKGYAVFFKKFDMYWLPFGTSLTGVNVYERHTSFIGSNPVLGSYSGINLKHGVIGYNSHLETMFYTNSDTSLLFETITRYATILAHVESTLTNSLINKRSSVVSTTATKNLADAIKGVFDKLELGEITTAQSNTAFIDMIQQIPIKDDNNITELIQVRDYIMNCFLNEIGVQTLEEKKDRMITQEINADEELLHVNISSMYEQRKQFVDIINALYGLNIEVYIKLGGFKK